MTMRRRRKKLSSIVYNMDRRIRSVELKKTVFTKAGLSPSVDDEVDPTLPEGTVYAGDAPNAWHRITGAYYYPARIIGSGDRAEIFLAASDSGLGAERGGVISMSRLQSSVGGVTINTTDSDPEYYTVRAYGTPNWTLTASNTRQSKQVNTTQVYFPLADTGSGVGHTYLFSPASDTTYSFPPFTLRYELKFRALVSKHSATTATATLTFSSGHHYQVDDVIEVMDLPSGYRGIDGIFKVKAITSTTLTYDFDTPLTAAITEANASSGVYVYSVAQEYVRDGATYINSSDGTVYYWDGLRYTLSAPPGLTNDGNAPSPPTDLVVTTSGYSLADGSPRSRVDLSWTAPTTSAGGGALDDLAGYRIFISETGYSNWTQKITYEKAVTAQTITNLDQNKQYYFRVVAYDSFGLDSTGLDGTQITGVAALSVTTPSAPIIPTVKFGVVTVKWDGKDSVGAVIPSQLLANIEVHASTTSGFTPSTSTLVGKIFSANDSCVVADLAYNTTYYFKFIANDKSGNSTSASVQTSAVVKPLVDADLIAAELNSPLSVWPFAAKAVTAGALADGALDASTVFGTGVITQSAISAGAIGATQIAANAITAGKIEANAVTTAKIDALAITAAKIATNAIEADKINAGAVTAVKIDSGAVTAGKITATDVFYFSGNSGTDYVRVGYQAVSNLGDSIGVAFQQGGSVVGWIGTWGAYFMDYGTSDTNSISMSQSGIYSNALSNYYVQVFDFSNNVTGFVLDGQNGAAYIDANTVRFSNRAGTEFVYIDANAGTSASARTLTVTGKSSTANTLIVVGRVTSNGTVLTSSARYKTEISPYKVSEKVLEIPVVTFRYDNSKINPTMTGLSETTIGVIAEDLIELGLSDYVDFDEKTGLPSGVDYSKIGISLIPIIKNLKNELEILKTKVGG
jgi:hypothetical protein